MKRRLFLGAMAATPVAPALAAVSGKNEEVEYLGEIQRVTLKPGDTLVLNVPGRLHNEAAQRLKSFLESEFAGHRVLVLGDGMKLGLIGS